MKITDKRNQICRRSILRVVLAVCLSALLLSGCATVPAPTRSERTGQTGPLGRCADFFSSLDRQTRSAAAIDAGVFRVKQYPYLRVNRFLVSFGGQADHPDAFEQWLDRMQALDQDARRYEIANLPDAAVEGLDPANGREGIYQRVAACGDVLRQTDFKDDESRQKLIEQVAVPDDYIFFRRVLGIYPLTSQFVSDGVSKWHAEARQSFSNKPPVNWQTIRYVPDREIDWQTLSQRIGPTTRDALGIPVYSQAQQEALFRWYAPVWEVQIQAAHDRIGTPVWNDNGVLGVDTRRPVTYTRLSFTRYQKQVLTQLNYIIWFPARPKRSVTDLYGGLLDGVNYRVTLDRDGIPLLYETVHNCGCYYKAYPTKRLRLRENIPYAEPPLVLSAPDPDPFEHFVTLAMQTGTHYVQHVYPLSRDVEPEAVEYAFADYGRLRSLPYLGAQRRSMFDPNGLAPGSERLERLILWPTGVVSPGAMRQWGRHAVAFVGRRHFDDPDYMDKMFEKPHS